MTDLLLSIVVPTQNRAELCVASVKAMLQHEGSFELVILDSSLAPMGVHDLPRDDRVRLMHLPPSSNITTCFEAAVAACRGEYLCIIGDDDGVTPKLFEWLKKAREFGWDSVSTMPESYALYNWPDIRSKYFGDAVAGKVYFRRSSLHLAPVNLEQELKIFLREGAQGCGVLPRAYHGLIARRLVDRIRARYGVCFVGVSPDVSFAMLASTVAASHVLIGDPLTISGASGRSNAGRSARREHKGDLWTDPHMRNFSNERWPAVIPEFFGVETVWAEAAWKAAELCGKKFQEDFGLGRLYALLLVRHFDRRVFVLQSLRAAREMYPKRNDLKLGAILREAMSRVVIEVGVVLMKVIKRVFPDSSVVVREAPGIEVADRVVADLLENRR